MVQFTFFKIHINHKAQLTTINMLYMGAVTIQQVKKDVGLQRKTIKIG
jgi:hypothetical protein